MNDKRSYTEYTVTTATTDFVIGFDDYDDITKDTIVVTVNGVLAESQGYAVMRKNAQVITITPAVQSGTVRLERVTDIDESFHQFTAGALFSAKSVDENFEQVRHSQQEVRDGFTFLQFNTLGIVAAAKAATQAALDAAQVVADLVLGLVRSVDVLRPNGLTQEATNAEVVSITDFGASPVNADNTTQINNANAYALSVGASVKYPHGEFKVLGDIPSLHKVQAYGSGAIVRGDNTFYVAPNNTQSNTIYIKPNGVGDGISRNSAMSIGDIIPALKNLQKRAGAGYWKIHFCVGTYVDKGMRFTDVPPFANQLEFTGDLKFTGEPDAIWDGTTSIEAYAMRCDLICKAQRVRVADISFINWDKTRNNGALVFWGGHQLITENVNIDKCGIGIWTSRAAVHRSIGDKINNCTTFGIGCQYSSSVIIGQIDKRTKITNCEWGLHIGRMSVGHNDYVDYDGNKHDIYITQNSRLAHASPTFKNWGVSSIYVQNGAVHEGLDVCTFDAASITDSTPILTVTTGAIIDSIAGKGTEVLHQSFVPTVGATITGTVDNTNLSGETGFGSWVRIPKYLLYQGEGIGIRMRAYVQGTGTAANSEFILAGAGSSASLTILKFKLPNGGYGGYFDVNIDVRKDGAMYAYGTLTTNQGVVYAQATVSASVVNANFRDKTKDLAQWRLYLKPAATADTFTLLSQKTWITL